MPDDIHSGSEDTPCRSSENYCGTGRPSKNTVEVPRFDFVCSAKENHNSQLYGIAVNNYATSKAVFATCGHNRCTVYQLSNQTVDLLGCYSDGCQEEIFYCCVWLFDLLLHKHLVAVAGKKGVVHIVSPKSGVSLMELKGHGNSINEMAVSPTDANLLLSASKDYTVRLWNVRCGICVAIFGGINGHSDEALSVDFDPFGRRLVSSGIDHTVKVWDFSKNEAVVSAIRSSENYLQLEEKGLRRSFKAVRCDFPDFSTKEIHSNYVDSVRWFGDLIISKRVTVSSQISHSCENFVSLWKPGDLSALTFSSESDVTKIRDFEIKNCNVWFMKLTISWDNKWLAAGNQCGKIYVWSLLGDISTKPRILHHPKCNSLIRQIAFTSDNNTLLAVCDDSSIWRWEAKFSS